MSSGFYLVSGFLYVNLGCQSLFVLANRMRAQRVDMKTIGSKILCDITLTMFKNNFIENLLKPQTPLTIPNLYQIINKIVNCSFMKLDKGSMEKLFYLILMTFKRQLFLFSSPLQLYSVTLIHLQDALQLQKENPQAKGCLEQAIYIYKNATDHLSFLQYMDLREELLSMLEAYKSKIVLFSQNGSQDQSGCFIFTPRQTHNRKNIGMGHNHQSLDFQNSLYWQKTKNLQYSNYKNWKSLVGKDDYDNIRGSSKISELKPKRKDHLQQDNRQIYDMLGIKNMNIDNFQVRLDIFKQGQKKIQSKGGIPVKSVVGKGQTTTEAIKNKINQEFNFENEKKQENEDIDLLDLMDS